MSKMIQEHLPNNADKSNKSVTSVPHNKIRYVNENGCVPDELAYSKITCAAQKVITARAPKKNNTSN